ncbi:SusC/RagA family TonB-linked outer membrane protein [Mucilaginibacter lacusdianchii]|uniref:SusC/RagA family TonB-linked outer membrane protein n=1 Tax=Mucilaginibacter lacusdianchii TaxID=2684211 RepID=UPI00131C63E3|nr:SusC/RagA family TonB-linked outer membrane protein [Mucilaginibacter sp. JXJ CY 39]
MKKVLLVLLALCTFVLNDVFAQSRKITGKVLGSDDGLPVTGATVRVVNSTIGVQTDANGNFSINVPSNATSLAISFIGFTTQNVSIAGKDVVDVKLQANNNQLTDVVVIGYGSGKRAANVVGTVSTVSSKEIENKPVANAFDALQGKVAGLQIFTSSGEPSETPSIRINGVGSLTASSSPLFLLDGIPVDQTTITSLNPNDFEDVTVLKDASSTSIYGARAANGVIYITTKKGSTNRPSTIQITTQAGIAKIANKDFFNRLMNAQQLLDFRLNIPTGLPGALTQQGVNDIRTQFGANTDTKWYDYFYKDQTPTFQTVANVNGGGGKTTYYVSAGYYKQPGLAYRSNYERYTLRSNINSVVNNWMQFGLNLSGGYDIRQTNPYGSNSTARGLGLLAAPYYPTVDPSGNDYTFIPGWNAYNPRYRASKNIDPRNKTSFNPTGYIQLTPFKGLTLKSQAGLDAYDYRFSTIRLPSYLGSINNGSVREEFQRNITRTVTNTAEYRFSFLQKNHMSVLAGQESIDNSFSGFWGSSTGQVDDRLILLNNGPSSRDLASYKSEYSFHSLFGRVSYDFDTRYFVDASIRQDKSSRFGANNRSATFWSVGGMWKLKEESFLKEVNWLDDLSLRVSTGTTGNSDFGVDNQNYLSLALGSTNTYNGGAGLAISAPGNPDLTWEKQQNTTFDVTATVFDKVRLDVAFYNRVTTQMLLAVPYAYTTGYSSIYQNIGKLKNWGWDVSLDFDVYKNRSKKAYITPYLNFNFNQNKVQELFNGKNYWVQQGTGVAWVVGQPVSFLYPIWKGVNSQTGLPEWYVPGADPGVTRKDDNAITNTFNTAGLQQNTGIGRYPKLNGGFGLNAGYQGFTLAAQFSFSTKKYLINNDRYFYENPSQFAGYNQYTTITDYWKQPGDVTRFPKYGVQFTQFDSRLIEDASFLRLKVFTLGYSVPESLLKRTKAIKGLNLFLTGRNLLTFTKYTGPDPEVDSNLALGTNPNTKQYTIGLDVKF